MILVGQLFKWIHTKGQPGNGSGFITHCLLKGRLYW